MPRLRTPLSNAVNIRPVMNVIHQEMLELRNHEVSVGILSAAYLAGDSVTDQDFEASLKGLRDRRKEADARIEAALRALVENSAKMARGAKVQHVF